MTRPASTPRAASARWWRVNAAISACRRISAGRPAKLVDDVALGARDHRLAADRCAALRDDGDHRRAGDRHAHRALGDDAVLDDEGALAGASGSCRDPPTTGRPGARRSASRGTTPPGTRTARRAGRRRRAPRAAARRSRPCRPRPGSRARERPRCPHPRAARPPTRRRPARPRASRSPATTPSATHPTRWRGRNSSRTQATAASASSRWCADRNRKAEVDAGAVDGSRRRAPGLTARRYRLGRPRQPRAHARDHRLPLPDHPLSLGRRGRSSPPPQWVD